MWGLVGKLLLLGVARRFAKRPTAAAETAALALVLVGADRRIGRGRKRDLLIAAAHVIFLPAAVIKTVRLVKRLAAKRGRDGLPPAPQAPLDAAAPGDPLSAAAIPTFRHQPPPLPRPVPRSEWGLIDIPDVAHEYAAWTRCLRNVLAQQGMRSLPPGYDPDGLELLRYLLYNGILAATKPSEAARSVAVAAARVTGTIAWRSTFPFMTDQELREWEDVAWWEGPDADGTLWLHLHLARAVTRTIHGQGRECGWAVVSQLDYGIRTLLTGGGCLAAAASPGGPGSAASTGGGEEASTAASTAGGDDADGEGDGEGAVGDGECSEAGGAGGEEGGARGRDGSARRHAGAALGAAAATPTATAARGGRARAAGHAAAGTAADGAAEAEATHSPTSGAAAATSGATAAAPAAAAGLFRRRRRAVAAATAAAAAASGSGSAGAVRLDDRIRVVVVGTGSNVRQALRVFPLMREFARLVQRHYPGRLRTMYLADLPRGLRLSVGMVLNLLPAETRHKLKVCAVEDLPDCIAGALAVREAAQLAAPLALHGRGRGGAAVGIGGGLHALGVSATADGEGAADGGGGLAHIDLGGLAHMDLPSALRLRPASVAAAAALLRLWLVRVLLMAACCVCLLPMAALSYRSLLARW